MEQAELDRLRAEKAQACQVLEDAIATLEKVAASLRDLPKLQMPVGGSEKQPAPRSTSGWVATARPPKQRTKAKQEGVHTRLLDEPIVTSRDEHAA